VSNIIELGELHERQSECFESIATEIMYGGAAGGGKSHMMRVLAVLWSIQIPGLMVYIFRRLSDDLYKNHMMGPSGFLSMLAPQFENGYCKYNEQKKTIVFNNGSRIFLSHCQYEKDLMKYQGAEMHVLMIDELTHFSDNMYRYLRGRCRIPKGFDIPEDYRPQCPKCHGKGCSFCKQKGELRLFPRIISGTNPGGVGHAWVKREFVDRMSPMAIERMGKSDGGFIRQYIPAKLSDNPSLDEDYEDSLSGLGSPELVKAMKDGDWNIVAGGAFDDLWNRNRHVVQRFQVPTSWALDRAFDWGSTHPFSVMWFAESDGSEAIMPDGTTFCPPKGSLVVFHEWYGADDKGKGLKMSPKEISKLIKIREISLSANDWIQKDVEPGPADNQISNVMQKDVPSIEKQMEKEGITWTKSDKSAGSRINGLQLIRDMLEASTQDNPESPGLYFMEHCNNIIAHLPVLSRDKKNTEDIDTTQDDHDYDALRYRILGRKQGGLIKRKMHA
jgi:hypothetical protein